jgi:hypothetical protein
MIEIESCSNDFVTESEASSLDHSYMVNAYVSNGDRCIYPILTGNFDADMQMRFCFIQ